MSKLLFNEKPIMIIPSLAKKIGLNVSDYFATNTLLAHVK